MYLIIVALFLCIASAFLLLPRNHKSGKAKEAQPVSSSTKKESKIYSKSEISSHNKRDDCWIIIKNRVYDVSSYVEAHPGGDAILVHAGDDTTAGFFGPQHPTSAFDMIEDFYIGDLKQ